MILDRRACVSHWHSALPYKPTWRGISSPGQEVVTCWSTSHTCHCNGYDHWGAPGSQAMREERWGGGRNRGWGRVRGACDVTDGGGVKGRRVAEGGVGVGGRQEEVREEWRGQKEDGDREEKGLIQE